MQGDRFITGSYDRTCKVWNTVTGEVCVCVCLRVIVQTIDCVRVHARADDKFVRCVCVCVCACTLVQELLTLEGHKNVVYAIAFNNPFGDKIITGSYCQYLCVMIMELESPKLYLCSRQVAIVQANSLIQDQRLSGSNCVVLSVQDPLTRRARFGMLTRGP